MTKAVKYWILAIIMAILGLVEAITGFVLWFGFPSRGGIGGHGLGGGLRELTFWELSRHTWIEIHDWVAVALVVFIAIHLVLHWKWIVRVAKSVFFMGKAKTLAPVPVESNE